MGERPRKWNWEDPAALRDRAWRATTAWLGHDVRVELGLTAAIAVVGVLVVGFNWLRVIAITVVGWVVLVAVSFICNACRFAYRRYWNGEWTVLECGVPDAPRALPLGLISRDGLMRPLGVLCKLTTPDGRRWESGKHSQIGPGGVERVDVYCPAELDGRPLVSGDYKILWQEVDKRGNWHEIVRTTLAVTIPKSWLKPPG